MQHQLHTEIVIEASPAAVWAVLTDLERYPEWNPFIVEAEGPVEVGARLTNRLQAPGGKTMTFKPRVTEVEPLRSFEWLGRLVAPGVFDGRHRFELHPAPEGTRLIHSEQFNGLLVRMFKRRLDADTAVGFEAMNRALADRVEQVAQSS